MNLVSAYLKKYSLVESNIISFNNFIEKRMQEIVSEVNETLPKEEPQIKLGKIRVGKPNITEADGSCHTVLPAECRLRNLTYSAPIYLEIMVKREKDIEQQEVEIGRIPVMVKSKYCNIHNLSEEELIKNYNDPLDFGGYFIINGNERVLVMIEDLAPNQFFCEENNGKVVLRLFSQRGSYRIPTTISEASDGTIEVTFSRFSSIPFMILTKALGVTSEAEIAKIVGEETDIFIINLYKFASLQNSEEAFLKIAEMMGLEGTKKEILDRARARVDTYFLPHIEERKEKAITLCKYVKYFLKAREKKLSKVYFDKDHYANKRVRLSGDLLADLFRSNLSMLARELHHNLQKAERRKRTYSIKTLAKSTLFSHRIESAIATGNWIGQKTGVTQNMDKTNCFSILSQLQRVSSLLPGEQENFLARTLHPTHYGRFCPIETPEGTEIGLRKNLALLARISTATDMNEKQFLEFLYDIGLSPSPFSDSSDSDSSASVDVFYNGKYIGSTKNEKFVEIVREKRRKGELPRELSIRKDECIIICDEPGRVLRPLLLVHADIENIESENEGENKEIWDKLWEKGFVEYIDASEEENLLVALSKDDATEETTHIEINPIDLLGVITSLVPYGNHDQSSRLNRGSKTQKQSLGLYSANFLSRLDTDVNILYYPQKPIVRSFVYDSLDVYPAGQNAVVAIMTYRGYNVGDAIVLNKGSVERGFGRSTYFRPYMTTELHYPGGLSDNVCVPTKDTSGYRTESAYKFLEDDGIVYVEADLSENDVVIGKTSPPKFLTEIGEITIKTRKESSVAIRQGEKGKVDAVFVTTDHSGNKIVQVRTRDERIPELGDKFSTSHGQKGVVGLIVEEEDMPFTASGIRPDIIFNPHGIPSRMTIGYLLELLAGKVGCLSGKIVDGSSFAGTPAEFLEKKLLELGFRYDGKETMFDGITGEIMEAKIFIGNMYYLKLKYMVANKIHARASGKVTLLTRQPIEGRAKGGALRLGEMEQQVLVAHGASLLLKERYDSDRTIMRVCTKCGAIAIKDVLHDRVYCQQCQTSKIEAIEVSYAFKLLVDELLSMHILPRFELKNKYE